jgi:hypothetical protein
VRQAAHREKREQPTRGDYKEGKNQPPMRPAGGPHQEEEKRNRERESTFAVWEKER